MAKTCVAITLAAAVVGCDQPRSVQPQINEAAAIVAGVLATEPRPGEVVQQSPQDRPIVIQTCFGVLHLPSTPKVGDIVIDNRTGRQWQVVTAPPKHMKWSFREVLK